MRRCKHESSPGSGRSVEWQQRDLVWRSTLRTREKVVLLAFLDFDRLVKGNELFPALERVAQMTSLSYAAVHKSVKGLRGSRILEAVGYVASRYALRGRVVRYRFHPEQLPLADNVSRDTLQETEAVQTDRLGNGESVGGDGPDPVESVDFRQAPTSLATDSTFAADRLYGDPPQTPTGRDKRSERHERYELRTTAAPPDALTEHHLSESSVASAERIQEIAKQAHVVMAGSRSSEPNDPSLIAELQKQYPTENLDDIRRALGLASIQNLVGTAAGRR